MMMMMMMIIIIIIIELYLFVQPTMPLPFIS